MQSLSSPGFVGSREEGWLYDCLEPFSNFFPTLIFTASVPGDVGAFMTGHGQTSVMCLKLWFLLLQKRWFSCEAIL